MTTFPSTYVDQTISHATLLTAHLFPVFVDLLARVDPDQANVYRLAFSSAADPDQDEILADLMDTLSNHAPEGTSFGAHPGDGSDFGFWSEESDEPLDEREQDEHGAPDSEAFGTD